MKKIALTQRLVEAAEYPETRDALDLRWGGLLRELGVLPVVLPTGYDCLPYFDELGLDGIILTGGNDLSRCCDSPLSALRDRFEGTVLSLAVARRIPVLGICRGMQFIGDRFGLSLERVQGHGAGARHRLEPAADSRFAVLVAGLGEVNSYHCYALAGTSEELIVSARSADGAIEAIEHRELPIFGQMWHPERERDFTAGEVALVAAALGL